MYRWRVKTRLPERFGQPCNVTARGRLNSVRVEFADGFWCITSRWNVRRTALNKQAITADAHLKGKQESNTT